jgi:hypothetical protein
MVIAISNIGTYSYEKRKQNYLINKYKNTEKKQTNFINIYDSFIAESLIIKNFYLKIKSKLNGSTNLVFTEYPIYKTICNIFENAILKGNYQNLEEEISETINLFEEKTEDNIKNYLNSEEGFNFFKNINSFFTKKSTDNLIQIIDTYQSDTFKCINEGRKKLLDLYLCSVSILVGLENIQNNKLLFYYQPLYLEYENFGEIVKDLCENNLNKDTNIIFEFKLLERQSDFSKTEIKNYNDFIYSISELKKIYSNVIIYNKIDILC